MQSNNITVKYLLSTILKFRFQYLGEDEAGFGVYHAGNEFYLYYHDKTGVWGLFYDGSWFINHNLGKSTGYVRNLGTGILSPEPPVWAGHYGTWQYFNGEDWMADDSLQLRCC